MKELTPNEESMIRELAYTVDEIRKLNRSAKNQYLALLDTLGEKADCHLCGNRHWPLCKEIDDAE